jgi:hypothetical protein
MPSVCPVLLFYQNVPYFRFRTNVPIVTVLTMNIMSLETTPWPTVNIRTNSTNNMETAWTCVGTL